MSPRLTICSIVLLALLLGLGYAENPLTEPPTSPHPAEQDAVPISSAQTSRLPELTSATSISYPFREGVEVCLVSPPGLAVLLQADQSAGLVGDFLVQRFDESLFRLSHLVWACQSPGASGTPVEGNCAQVWIEVLREVSISERGSFWVTFRPAGGGPAIHTLFSYGPRHITYRGTIPDSGPVFIPATAEGIIFELRDSEFTLAEETVCESLDGESYQQSTLLGSRGKFDMQCAEAISSVAGGYSRPYVMNIHLDNVSTASQLSLRQISVSFSPTCALTQVPSSAPLNVTGVSMEEEVVTTDTTTEQPTTPVEGSTTASGHSTTHSTQEPTTTISTTLPPSSPNNDAHTVVIVVVLVVLLAVVIILVIMLSLFGALWYVRHRKKSAAAEKNSKHDEESNTKELDADVKVKSAGPRDVIDSGIVADGQLSFAESKTTGSSSPPCTVESLRKSDVQTPSMGQSECLRKSDFQTPSTGRSERRVRNTSPLDLGSFNLSGVDTPKSQRAESACSETESEGSEVHLLKQIANGLQDVKKTSERSELKLSQLTHQIKEIPLQISDQHEKTSEALDYVSEKVDEINLSR